jgi:aquaporin Z
VESNAKAAIAEGIGTFALIFFGAGSVVLYLNGQLDLVGVALATGLVIAIMVSQMAHLSGGVFNPAIQIALWVTGKVPSSRTVMYLGAQLIGAAAAALLLKFLVPAQAFDAALGGVPTLGDGISSGKGILLEAVGTFFLVWAVFATIVDDRGPFGKTADEVKRRYLRDNGVGGNVELIVRNGLREHELRIDATPPEGWGERFSH